MTPEPLDKRLLINHEPCFVCNKALRQAVTGRDVIGEIREWGGHQVWMHKHCAKQFDSDQQTLYFEDDSEY